MKAVLFVTLQVLLSCIYADVGYEDLPGKYLVEPEVSGLRFCEKELRIEAKGNTITDMVFGENDRVCGRGNLTMRERRYSPDHDLVNILGRILSLEGPRVTCDGVDVSLLLIRPSVTHQWSPIGFEKNHTYVQDELYLTIYEIYGPSCEYKGIKDVPVDPSTLPSIVPQSAGSPGEQIEVQTKKKKTPIPLWYWLGPFLVAVALITSIISVAFATGKLRCFCTHSFRK